VQKRNVWDVKSMVMAIKAVRNKKMGLPKASEMFSIPRATPKEIGIILASTVSVVWTFLLRG
jgi:hypothetical protein